MDGVQNKKGNTMSNIDKKKKKRRGNAGGTTLFFGSSYI